MVEIVEFDRVLDVLVLVVVVFEVIDGGVLTELFEDP